MSIAFPAIDPVIVSVGPFAVRWYALAYVMGIVLGGLCINYLNAKTSPHLPRFNALDQLLTYAVLGIILGGRLGYVFFYQWDYFSEHPLEIFQMWHGGMSFHGGLVGTIVGVFLFCRRQGYSFWHVADLMAVVAPIGLCFGRVANFVNGELYGRASDVPWAIVFPRGGVMARHPSQLYEAALEGMVLFVTLFALARFTKARERKAFLSGVFLMGYSVARMVVECFREPDDFLGFILGPITMGQILSLPMFVLGVVLVTRGQGLGIRD